MNSEEEKAAHKILFNLAESLLSLSEDVRDKIKISITPMYNRMVIEIELNNKQEQSTEKKGYKLSLELREEILKLYETHQISRRSIARKFGISNATVSKIIREYEIIKYFDAGIIDHEEIANRVNSKITTVRRVLKRYNRL